MHRTTAEATRARKGLARVSADAASLLNYHPERETPPAWALRRRRAFPAVWAHHASERLGEAETAPVTFGGRRAEEVRAALGVLPSGCRIGVIGSRQAAGACGHRLVRNGPMTRRLGM